MAAISDYTTPKRDYIINEGSLKIDLFGAKKENVEVTLEGGKIRVVSTKKNLLGQTCKFDKTFILDTRYNPETIKVTYDDGILEIVSEKYESQKLRKLEIH